MTKLSFVMPAFNAEATAHAAVSSVLQQEISVPFELVVVDDGSTDGTPRVLEALAERDADRVCLGRHDRNRGGGAARNTAIGLADGDLLYLVDADNVLPPGVVEPQVRRLLADNLDAVSVESVRFFRHEDGRQTHAWTYRLPGRTLALRDLFLTHIVPPSGGNYLFTRELFDAVGGYYHDRGAMESWTFGFKHTLAGFRMGLAPETYYLHRMMRSEAPSYWEREERAGFNDANALGVVLDHVASLPADLAEKVSALAPNDPFFALITCGAFASDVSMHGFQRKRRRTVRQRTGGWRRRLLQRR